MGKRVVAVTVVLWVAVTVDVCMCFESRISSDVLSGENARLKAEELKRDGDRIMHDAMDISNSWSDWVHAKYKQFTDTMNTAASEGSEYASEKTHETASNVKDFASDKTDQVIRMVSNGRGRGVDAYDMHSDLSDDEEDESESSGNAYENAKQNINVVIDTAKEKGVDGKETMENPMERRKDRYAAARDEMEESKNKASETYYSAKARHEAAKEKVSKATGEVGNKMRKDTAGGEL